MYRRLRLAINAGRYAWILEGTNSRATNPRVSSWVTIAYGDAGTEEMNHMVYLYTQDRVEREILINQHAYSTPGTILPPSVLER